MEDNVLQKIKNWNGYKEFFWILVIAIRIQIAYCIMYIVRNKTHKK